MKRRKAGQTAWPAVFLFASSVCLFYDPKQECSVQLADLSKAGTKKLNIFKLYPWLKIGAVTTEESAPLIEGEYYISAMFEGFLGNAFEGLDHACSWRQAMQMPGPPLRETGPHELWFGSWSVERNCKEWRGFFSHIPQEKYLIWVRTSLIEESLQ